MSTTFRNRNANRNRLSVAGANTSTPNYYGSLSGYAVNCGGAVSIGADASLSGKVRTGGAFTAGANSIVNGAVECLGDFTFGAGSRFTSQPTPLTSFSEISDPVDLIYSEAKRLEGDAFPLTDTVKPGDYVITGAYSIDKTITLVGSDTDEWIIRVGGALTVSGNIQLSSDAKAKNVHWVIEGALTTAAKSTFYGNVLCTGAISMGAESKFTGNVYSSAGALTVGANATFNFSASPAPVQNTSVPVNYGSLSTYAVNCGGAVSIGANASLSGKVRTGGAFTVGASSIVEGDVESVGALSLGAGSELTGQPTPLTSFSEISDQINVMYNQVKTLKGDAFPLGTTVKAGSYLIAGAYSIDKTITLVGSETDEWIIHVGGALTVSGKIQLSPKARACNVHWVIEGALSTAAESTFHGNVLCKGAISLGAGSKFTGNVYSSAGALTVAANATFKSPGSPLSVAGVPDALEARTRLTNRDPRPQAM